MPDPGKDRIARRLRAIREERGLTQQALSDLMGLSHRQSLAAIEAGERSVSPEELVGAASALGVGIEAFTDPFRLVGEGRFSFRAEGVATDVLDAFQRHAGQWVATSRALLERRGVRPSHLAWKLELTAGSRFEDAHAAAEEIRRAWDLGPIPADTLGGAIERHLGVQVLYVDAPRGVSGAAIQLPGLHTILINRREPAGRRHFDLAHELFHILTWDAMAPERVEPLEAPPTKGNRVEKLADNFAGALLVPEDVATPRWVERGAASVVAWLNQTATELRVSSVALKWRLVVLGLLTKPEADSIEDNLLAGNGGAVEDDAPTLFSAGFVRTVHGAVEDGFLSIRKATRILGLSPRAFVDLCNAHGLALSYDP